MIHQCSLTNSSFLSSHSLTKVYFMILLQECHLQISLLRDPIILAIKLSNKTQQNKPKSISILLK